MLNYDDEVLSAKTHTHAGDGASPAASYEFPMSVFPKRLKEIITEICTVKRFSEDFVGLSVLTAASALIGNRFYAQIDTDFTVSSSLYSVLVAKSGQAKSPIINFALEPIHHIEKQYESFDRENLQSFESALEDYQTADKDEKPTKPKAPKRQEITINDATVEAICQILSNNPNGAIMYQDELVAWLNGMNQYKGGKGMDEQFWLEVKDNSTRKVSRSGGKTISLRRPFISVLGGLQPKVLPKLGGDDRSENGFLFRLLFAYPAKPPRTTYYTGVKCDPSIFTDYRNIMLFLHPPVVNRYVNETEYEPDPIYLPLHPEADKSFQEYSKANADYIDNHYATITDAERSVLVKLVDHIVRFALICELLAWAELCAENPAFSNNPPYCISKESLDKGYVLFEYFRETAKRVRLELNLEEKTQEETTEQKVRRLHSQGKTQKEIAEILGISQSQVSKILRK